MFQLGKQHSCRDTAAAVLTWLVTQKLLRKNRTILAHRTHGGGCLTLCFESPTTAAALREGCQHINSDYS